MGNTVVKSTASKIRKIEREMWFIINGEYINNNLDNLVKDTQVLSFLC